MDKKIELHYLLSPEGQKKSLLSGDNGKKLQKVYIDLEVKLLNNAIVDMQVYTFIF